MRFQFSLNRKVETVSIKHALLALIIILISIAITVLGQLKSFTGNKETFFKGGFVLLNVVYAIKIAHLFPILVFIRLIREREKYTTFMNTTISILKTSISIILWAFVPVILVWAGMSILNLTTIVNIPWSVFSETNFWLNALFFPFTLSYSYWKFTKHNITDSLLDSMILSGLALIIHLIHSH